MARNHGDSFRLLVNRSKLRLCGYKNQSQIETIAHCNHLKQTIIQENQAPLPYRQIGTAMRLMVKPVWERRPYDPGCQNSDSQRTTMNGLPGSTIASYRVLGDPPWPAKLFDLAWDKRLLFQHVHLFSANRIWMVGRNFISTMVENLFTQLLGNDRFDF